MIKFEGKPQSFWSVAQLVERLTVNQVSEEDTRVVVMHPSRFAKGDTFRVRYTNSGPINYYLVTDDEQAVQLNTCPHLVKLNTFGELVKGEKVNLRLTVVP